MNLPPTWEQARGAIERAFRQVHHRNRDLELGDGRVVIRSPNGARWAITVSNAGALSATPA